MDKKFVPDYNNLLDVVLNKRPKRLPLYEHHIDTLHISKHLGKEIVLQGNRPTDFENHYRELTQFWKDMTYDGFDYEAGVCEIFPGHGALVSGKPGPIQTRADFEKYPFNDLATIFWETYTPHFEALQMVMPAGMKAFGGIGYGIFEASQDLVGYEQLCVMQYLDPELFRDLIIRIGDLYCTLWIELINRYSNVFVFFRMGDDLGFKTSTLLEPNTIRNHILPQYKRIIDIVHRSGKKFLLHSCGNIFEVMNDIIDLGIDAKHSNEDEIAPFETWIEKYNDKIGLFGGVDVNILTLNSYDEVFRIVREKGSYYRSIANGYGLGSGNSIPDYVPNEGFLGMVDAVKYIRKL